jgi:spoIIIJ-associated protein
MAERPLHDRVGAFVKDVVEAMGLDLSVTAEQQPDHVRVNLDGAQGEVLLRRKGEALDALQLIVNTAFRRDIDERQRLVVDCLGFRKAKDGELRHMTRFLMEKVRTTGLAQEIGPLNSYARRLVHLEVSSSQDLVSESQGDSAMKTVIISLRDRPR